MQVIKVGEVYIQRKKIAPKQEKWKARLNIYAGSLAVGVFLVACVVPSGYFGPLSSRVRGLFVQHTRTGNPLVDSVAEHQPASQAAYYQYLNVICNLAPVGFLMAIANFNDQHAFLILYALVTYFFSAKMVRLIILTGPVASCLAGYFLGWSFDWSVRQVLTGDPPDGSSDGDKKGVVASPASAKKKAAKASGKPKAANSLGQDIKDLKEVFNKRYVSVEGQVS